MIILGVVNVMWCFKNGVIIVNWVGLILDVVGGYYGMIEIRYRLLVEILLDWFRLIVVNILLKNVLICFDSNVFV